MDDLYSNNELIKTPNKECQEATWFHSIGVNLRLECNLATALKNIRILEKLQNGEEICVATTKIKPIGVAVKGQLNALFDCDVYSSTSKDGRKTVDEYMVKNHNVDNLEDAEKREPFEHNEGFMEKPQIQWVWVSESFKESKEALEKELGYPVKVVSDNEIESIRWAV